LIMNSDFLLKVLQKYATADIQIHITDASTRILASTDQNRIGLSSNTAQYIVRSMRSAVIESGGHSSFEGGGQETVTYGTPFFFENELCGTVIARGQPPAPVQQGNIIKAALETAFEYQRYNQSVLSASDDHAQIANQLLADKVDVEKTVSMMNKIEMDPSLLRCVICVSLAHHQTSYFNINLSLGYQSSIERIKDEAAARLKASRYLNSQDIIYVYNRNTILVIKSFIPVDDLSRIYLSLDKICEDFEKTLSSFTSFSFNMAYGNLYQGITDLKKSFNEAMETIDIGHRTNPEQHLYVLENILFDNICHFLHPQIVNKILKPTIAKLTRKDNTLPTEIIECAEAFVDHCMSLSETSEKIFLHRNTIRSRLDKLESITGLRPATSFKDAFIVKMLAAYLKLHEKE